MVLAVQPIFKKKFLTFFPDYLHSFHLKNSVLVILKMAKLNISLIIVLIVRYLMLNFNPKHFQFLKLLG